MLRPGPLAQPAELVSALRARHVHAALVLLNWAPAWHGDEAGRVAHGSACGKRQESRGAAEHSSFQQKNGQDAQLATIDAQAVRQHRHAGQHAGQHSGKREGSCSPSSAKRDGVGQASTHVHLGQGLVLARIQLRFSLSALFLICKRSGRVPGFPHNIDIQCAIRQPARPAAATAKPTD